MLAIVVTSLLGAILVLCHLRTLRGRTVPDGLPWVGLRDEWFPIWRANMRNLTHAKENLEEGYLKYGKQDIPFIAPNVTGHPEVVLPKSFIKWLVELPDEVMSISAVLQRALHFSYTSPRSWSFAKASHVEALNKMNLDAITSDIVDEISYKMDRLWGQDTDTFKDVVVFETMASLLTAVTNRVFVGLPLCRNEEYLHWMAKFVELLPVKSMQIELVPEFLRPILAPLIARPCRLADRRCVNFLLPLISERLEVAKRSLEDGTFIEPQREDIIDKMARLAVKSADPLDKDPHSISSRILALNFVGVHTSTFAMANAVFDLVSAPTHWIELLQAEVCEVFRQSEGKWSKHAVAKLQRLDSFFRESLRFSIFKGRGLVRQVVADEGVTAPDGTFLAKGSRVGLPTSELQHDTDLYPGGERLDPLRFLGKKNMTMVNTTDSFLAFGYGRHACPGRFFASHELKLAMAYILMHYEIKPLEERPENTWIGDFCCPPWEGTVSVRRRTREEVNEIIAKLGDTP